MKTQKTEVRVRYDETDRMGVVYYGKYFTWLEVARTEFFRNLGMPYADLESEGIRLMVTKASCAYKSPSTYDELLAIETSIKDVGNTSLAFSYVIFRKDTLIATAETVHVFTDQKGKPIRIPQKARKVLSALTSE
ncbi:MAG: acyl-CoA thioesterase [Candidatus Omnitrophica bacterium]|nr:acyl-CoA thioesterase [Candidatus Omnitrophota bacterium]